MPQLRQDTLHHDNIIPESLRYQNIIPHDDDASIANVICFGAFADKNTGVVYNDMTGNFPFVSIDGSVCYFIMYHYESNSILATPINGLTDIIICEAYKKIFPQRKTIVCNYML